MVADIAGVSLETPKEDIGAAYGDALMAAIGVGFYQGFQICASNPKEMYL